jgi:hypothetical protein
VGQQLPGALRADPRQPLDQIGRVQHLDRRLRLAVAAWQRPEAQRDIWIGCQERGHWPVMLAHVHVDYQGAGCLANAGW